MGQYIRSILLAVIDTLIIGGSVYLAYLLRFDFGIQSQFIPTLPYVILTQVVLTICCLIYFKIYRRVWQYASIGDLFSIVKSVLLSTVLFVSLHYIAVRDWYPQIIIPRSIYILTALIMVFGIGGSRFVWRMLRDSYTKIQPHHRRALIIGAGSTGTMVVKELKHSESEYYPIAFIDDDQNKKKLEVLGIPVVGNRHDIPAVVERFAIKDIIIALPSASRDDIAEIISISKQTSCNIKIMPRVNDLINGKVSISMIRNVDVEDLLGREPVKLDMDTIADYLTDKVVLVTGAGGSIGSELCRQISLFNPKKLLLLGHGENSIYEIELELKNHFPNLSIHPIVADVQDKPRLKQVFEQFHPQVVFHAAAHKHIPLMESNPMEAIKNNVFGTKNVAECTHEYKAKRFVMVSTDKAVNPTNVMGATKKLAEMIVQGLNQVSSTHFAAVRFGNVLGSRGSVIPLFKKQIKEGGPVTVTHPEMIRYFMTIPEAVQLVIQTGALSADGEIFILDMGLPVKIADLAHDLIRLSGLEPGKDIQIIYTGIRPGEKLFEEILTSEEGTQATKHDRIFVGRSSDYSYEDLRYALQRLETFVSGESVPEESEIKRELQRLVPTYRWREDIKQPVVTSSVNDAIRASLEMVAALDKKTI